MGEAILCLAVCICDTKNKAGICGRSVHTITSQANLFCFLLLKSEPKWLHPEKLNFEEKEREKKEKKREKKILYKACRQKYVHIVRPVCFFSSGPL